MMPRIVFPILILILVSGCSPRLAPPPAINPVEALPVREFRGVWVATVANIDWPSRPGLPVEEQKREFRQLLDRAKSLNFNAIVFQVRPAADALYESRLEPWSEYLTGAMGRAPVPYYDPLTFAVEESHKRGLELHAWFNPFRAHHPTGESPISPDHVSVQKSKSVVAYGDYLWLNPGDPVAQEHSLAVMLDVVERYDIDGVHIDDYFYPYEISDSTGKAVPFPDENTYRDWLAVGDSMSVSDWRRMSIDNFVEQLYAGIKRIKPHVKFGISPFGIWRPGYPEQIQGYDAFEKLYADSRRWLQEGWVDYYTPQLYWKIEVPEQSYPVLLNWWLEQNEHDRHIWPGNYTSRVFLEGNQRWDPEEIINQIGVTRSTPGATGNVHFSMKAMFNNGTGMARALGAGPYATQALIPATDWLSVGVPPATTVLSEDIGSGILCTFDVGNTDLEIANWVVWSKKNQTWSYEILPGWQSSMVVTSDSEISSIVVRAVSRTGQVGMAGVLEL